MPSMPVSQLSPMIAPQSKPHNDSRSLIFRWTPLHTLITGKCVDEHDRVIQQLYCILLDCGRRSNLHNNGRLRGIVDALSIRRHALTEFVETHRRMYGRLDADRIDEFVALIGRLDQALMTAKKVHVTSITSLRDDVTADADVNYSGVRESKSSSVKRDSVKLTADGSSLSSRPTTPRASGIGRGSGGSPRGVAHTTPRRSPLDSKQGSTVPLLGNHDSKNHQTDSVSPNGSRAVGGIVIPPIRGIGNAAGENTFLRFVAPVNCLRSPSSPTVAADDDRERTADRQDNETGDPALFFSSQGKGRQSPKRNRFSQSPRRRELVDEAAATFGPITAAKSPRRPIGSLFDLSSTPRFGSTKAAKGQGYEEPDKPVRPSSGGVVGMLFTNPILEVDNFVRVEKLARRHDVEDPERLGWAGLTTWFDQEWQHLTAMHEKAQLTLRLQLQQQQHLVLSPYVAPQTAEESFAGFLSESGKDNSSFPQPERSFPQPWGMAQSVRPHEVAKSVEAEKSVECQPPLRADEGIPLPDAVMIAHDKRVAERQGNQQRIMTIVYVVIAVAVGVGLLLLDDVLDQYRPD